MRRIPKQARSKAKVSAIVEAANAQFRESGYEGLSTVEVAKRAGVSVGTLYQFFDNKDDLMQAIAEQHNAELSQFANTFLGPDAIYVPPSIMLGRMVDWLVDHNKRFPTFHQLFSSAWSDVALQQVLDETMASIIDGIARILQHHAPNLPPGKAQLAATVLVSMTKGMFAILDSAESAQHPAIIEEIKHIGLLYFQDLVASQLQDTT